MKKKLISLILVAVLGAGLLAGCSSSSDSSDDSSEAEATDDSSSSSGDTIKIGLSGPTTGDSAEAGTNVITGVEMAIAEVNEAGGIEVDGELKQVELIYYDTGSDSETGLSNCEKLITSDNVDFLFCEAFNSSVGIATMELAKKYDIAMATLEPVSSAITEKVEEDPESYQYFFKFGWNSDEYGITCANTILSLVESGDLVLENKTFAVCGDESDYGRSNLAAVIENMEAAGYTLVSENYWEMGATDLYSIISDIKTSGADMVFSCSTTVATGVAFIKQMNENGLSASTYPHMAIYYPGQPEFENQIGSAADGLLWTPMLMDTENDETVAAFAALLDDYCGEEATFDHLDGYSCMKVVLEAIEKAGTTEASAVAEALLDQDGYDVPKGHIVFDEDNHSILSGEGYVEVNAAQIQDSTSYLIYPESKAVADYIPLED